MKRHGFLTAICVLMAGLAPAQDLKMRDVFLQMPDSLMPYLTKNSRLDFVDFLDSKMKAEVRNELAGSSEMTALADDSLSIRMNGSLTTDMLLLRLSQSVDSVTQVVAVIETFMVDSVYGESTLKFYTPDWILMPQPPVLDEQQKQRISGHLKQNIYKKDEEILNKS